VSIDKPKMSNQYRLISAVVFIVISVTAGNADARYVCSGLNLPTGSSDPAGDLSRYGPQSYALAVIADNISRFNGTNSCIRNLNDYTYRQFPSYFNEAFISSASFERILDAGADRLLKAVTADSGELEFVTLSLGLQQSDDYVKNAADSLARPFKLADVGLHRIQLTNLYIKPIPEPTAISLVCLVLADWSSFININKQIIQF
jgi:hypothetical protein